MLYPSRERSGAENDLLDRIYRPASRTLPLLTEPAAGSTTREAKDQAERRMATLERTLGVRGYRVRDSEKKVVASGPVLYA